LTLTESPPKRWQTRSTATSKSPPPDLPPCGQRSLRWPRSFRISTRTSSRRIQGFAAALSSSDHLARRSALPLQRCGGAAPAAMARQPQWAKSSHAAGDRRAAAIGAQGSHPPPVAGRPAPRVVPRHQKEQPGDCAGDGWSFSAEGQPLRLDAGLPRLVHRARSTAGERTPAFGRVSLACRSKRWPSSFTRWCATRERLARRSRGSRRRPAASRRSEHGG
jgi:hypothetical protein